MGGESASAVVVHPIQFYSICFMSDVKYILVFVLKLWICKDSYLLWLILFDMYNMDWCTQVLSLADHMPGCTNIVLFLCS